MPCSYNYDIRISWCYGLPLRLPYIVIRCARIACENIRFSSLFAAGEVSPRETSPVAKSKEKRMFSQASARIDSIKRDCIKSPCCPGVFSDLSSVHDTWFTLSNTFWRSRKTTALTPPIYFKSPVAGSLSSAVTVQWSWRNPDWWLESKLSTVKCEKTWSQTILSITFATTGIIETGR